MAYNQASPLYSIDGQSYELMNSGSSFLDPKFRNSLPGGKQMLPNGNMWYQNGMYKPYNGSLGNGQNGQQGSGMYGDPFGTAMSGTQKGTLQPYVNRMTQNANSALYGGLLGYKPQGLVAGDAGGTPQNGTAPQFNMQSAIPQNGLNFTGFGNRSWMGK